MSAAVTIAPPWLIAPGLLSALDALEAAGATARFVGGCVRNAVIGAGATDLDIAVDRPPAETTRLLAAAGLPAIPTGFEHGTITTLVRLSSDDADETPIEVTSLRRDVETDGRRAVVAFTRDWTEDAARRDFTMNALYADRAGRVLDPTGLGLADLAARRLRFIGDPQARIREDALRILRFYRFLARYGDPGRVEPEDRAACARLAPLVAGLARERIGQETRKLLAAPDPTAAVAAMIADGVPAHAFGPEVAVDAAALARLVAAEAAVGRAPFWPARLAALTEASVDLLAERLRLSNAEATTLAAIRAACALPPHEAAYRHGAEAAAAALLLLGRADAASLAALPVAAGAKMPVTAADLLARGHTPGPALGAALRKLEDAWVASRFTLEREALVALAGA